MHHGSLDARACSPSHSPTLTTPLRRSSVDRLYPSNDKLFGLCNTRAGMTSGILFLFITVVFSLSQVRAARPNIFVPVTNATCQPEYAWMNNAEQRSPCLTVAYVIAACAGDSKSFYVWDLYEMLICCLKRDSLDTTRSAFWGLVRFA